MAQNGHGPNKKPATSGFILPKKSDVVMISGARSNCLNSLNGHSTQQQITK